VAKNFYFALSGLKIQHALSPPWALPRAVLGRPFGARRGTSIANTLVSSKRSGHAQPKGRLRPDLSGRVRVSFLQRRQN